MFISPGAQEVFAVSVEKRSSFKRPIRGGSGDDTLFPGLPSESEGSSCLSRCLQESFTTIFTPAAKGGVLKREREME